MPDLIAFSPRYRVFCGENHVILFNDAHQVVLEGAPAAWLAGALSGAAPYDDVRRRAGAAGLGADVAALIDELVEDALLVRYDAGMPAERVRRWPASGRPFAEIEAALAAVSVEVRSLGPPCEPLVVELAATGLQPREDARPVTIVLADDLLHDGLAGLHRELHGRGEPWILAVPGPLAFWAAFAPGRTACWHCLRRRLERRPLRQWMRHTNGTLQPAGLSPEAARWYAAKALRCIVEDEPRDEAALHRLDTTRWMQSRHPIRRLPSCPVCDLPAPPGPASAPETVERLGDPVTGIVTSLCPLGRRDDVHVWVAGHPLSYRIDSLDRLRAHMTCHSTGKGLTAAAARRSAVFEAAERLSGVWREGIPVVRASFRELGEDAIHPDALQLFSRRQIETRTCWNASQPHAALHVPEPFDETATIDWVRAAGLTDGRSRYIPAAYAYYDAPGAGRRYCLAHSNGCAAGRTLDHAILNGLYELIERDAVSLWWYNRIRRPAVDPASFGDDRVDGLVAAHHRLGRACRVLDVTAELDVPVFVALSRSDSDTSPQWLIGFGCSGDPAEALRNALAEMNQMLPLYLDGRPVPPLWTPLAEADRRADAFLYPQRGTERSSAVYPADDEGEDRLEERLAGLHRAGMRVYVVDQTDPDIGVPVARVIVPGLYHFWRRLGGRRLYEAPVRLGWRHAPAPEHALNPASIVL